MKARINTRLLKVVESREAPYEVTDDVLPGFILRVQPSGRMSYYVRYRDVRGRQKRWKLGTAAHLTPAQAREEARLRLGDVARGGDPVVESLAAATLSLGEFIEGPYADWACVNRRSGRTTVKRLVASFGPKYAGGKLWRKPLDELGTLDIERWRTQRVQAAGRGTAGNRDIACLKAALGKAAEWGMIAESPLVKVKLARTDRKKTIRVLAEAEEKALFEALMAREEKARARRDSHNQWRRERRLTEYSDLRKYEYTDFFRPMITVMLHTGIRRGEAFSLDWKDVDLQDAVLTVQGRNAKSGQTRVIPLNHVARRTLGAWRLQGPGTGLVFPSPVTGGRLDNVRKTWMELLKMAGIEGLRMHDLRHTFATRLIASGVDIETVRQLLGHTDITTTQVYLHTNGERMRAAVKVLGSRDGMK